MPKRRGVLFFCFFGWKIWIFKDIFQLEKMCFWYTGHMCSCRCRDHKYILLTNAYIWWSYLKRFIPGTWNIHLLPVVSIGWFRVKNGCFTKQLLETVFFRVPGYCRGFPLFPNNLCGFAQSFASRQLMTRTLSSRMLLQELKRMCQNCSIKLRMFSLRFFQSFVSNGIQKWDSSPMVSAFRAFKELFFLKILGLGPPPSWPKGYSTWVFPAHQTVGFTGSQPPTHSPQPNRKTPRNVGNSGG